MVRKDFAGPGPYPTYVLQTISKLTAISTNPFPTVAPNKSTLPIPSFDPGHASPPSPHHHLPRSTTLKSRNLPTSPHHPPHRPLDQTQQLQLHQLWAWSMTSSLSSTTMILGHTEAMTLNTMKFTFAVPSAR